VVGKQMAKLSNCYITKSLEEFLDSGSARIPPPGGFRAGRMASSARSTRSARKTHSKDKGLLLFELVENCS